MYLDVVDIIIFVFKVPIAIPILVLLITVAQIVLTFYQSPLDSVIALAVGLLGIPLYFLFVYWENKPIGFLNCQGKTPIFSIFFFGNIIQIIQCFRFVNMEDKPKRVFTLSR